MNRKLLIAIATFIVVVIGGVVYYVLANSGSQPDDTSNPSSTTDVTVASGLDTDLRVIATEVFKDPTDDGQLNVIGRIQNDSSHAKSANVQVALTGKDGETKFRSIAVSDIPAKGSKQFGAIEDGYPESIGAIEVKVTLVATFTD